MGWVEDGVGPELQSANDMCERMQGTHALFIGDSLSLQMYESWRARLRQQRFAAGEEGTCGSTADGATTTGGWHMSRRCEGPAPELCAGNCVNRADDNDRHSSSYAVCDNGATVFMAQAFNWIMDVKSFTSSVVDMPKCANRLHRSPSDFGFVEIPREHLGRMLEHVAKPMRTRRGVQHNASRIIVYYNQFAHLHTPILALQDCYASGLSDADAWSAARRDVMRFWAADMAKWAAAFRDLKGPLAERGLRLQVFWRSSPAACDSVCLPDKGARSLAEPGPLITGVLGSSRYSHDLVYQVNDIGRAAFEAAGHAVIDLEHMLGVRVDMHPASLPNPDGTIYPDTIHYCQPGPADWALDVLMRRALLS